MIPQFPGSVLLDNSLGQGCLCGLNVLLQSYWLIKWQIWCPLNPEFYASDLGSKFPAEGPWPGDLGFLGNPMEAFGTG